jgi:hypothetical protein
MSCGDVGKVLVLDDDTIRIWYRLYQEGGFDDWVSFGDDGSACRLSDRYAAGHAESVDHRRCHEPSARLAPGSRSPS